MTAPRDLICPKCRQRYVVTGGDTLEFCWDCSATLEPPPARARPADPHPATRDAAERTAILIFGAAWPDTVGRSAPYKRGVLDTLLHYGSGLPLAMPYALGSVQADAWLSGSDMARRLWKAHPAAHAGTPA
jgi:hypothetical protein